MGSNVILDLIQLFSQRTVGVTSEAETRPALAYIAHVCTGTVLDPQAANIHISIRLSFHPVEHSV